MLVIVCLSAAVSSSSRNCADSACARITASECPTTSCTSCASRVCWSRSRAISSAWSRSASAATWERCEACDRAENRSASPSSHGAISNAVPSRPAGSRQPFVPMYARRARTLDPGACRARRTARSASSSATANAAPARDRDAAEPDDGVAAPAGATEGDDGERDLDDHRAGPGDDVDAAGQPGDGQGGCRGVTGERDGHGHAEHDEHLPEEVGDDQVVVELPQPEVATTRPASTSGSQGRQRCQASGEVMRAIEP